MKNEKDIPQDIALRICAEVRDQQRIKLFTQCWGCMKFSKGDPSKMCFHDPPRNRGCPRINREFDRMN